ncbi:flagellar basal body-associated FliL family protein [Endothiovibrio diazotrophicus]
MKNLPSLLSALLLLFVAVGTAHAEAEKEGGAAPPAGPVYVDLGEPVIVNVYDQGVLHFLSIDVVALVESPADEALIHDNMPPIRHNLMMLYSSQDYPALFQTDTKKRLLGETLQTLQEVMQKEAGKPVVEEVFFNAFVIQ